VEVQEWSLVAAFGKSGKEGGKAAAERAAELASAAL